MCPMFDRRIIGFKLVNNILSTWRNEWIRRRRKKYKVGDKQNIRKINIFQDVFTNYINTLCDKWYSLDQELGIIFELSYWLGILNYWIKNRLYRSTTSRLHYYEHKNIQNIFQKYRSYIIQILLKSKYTSIYLYNPPQKDRYKLKLCKNHDTYIYENKNFIHAYENFYINPSLYINCPNCKIYKKSNYYSLYYIEIKSELDKDFLFTFYIPYNQLSLNISNIINNKRYNEGVFFQGRETIKNNIYIPSEQKTITILKDLIAKTRNYFY